MLSQTKGQTKPGITRHNTIGQNFLSRRSADIDASKIFDEVSQDLSIRDFLAGRQSPTYAPAGVGPSPKQVRGTKSSTVCKPVIAEVQNVDFSSLLHKLQQSPPGQIYQEIDVRMVMHSPSFDERSLKHWLDYLKLRELQGQGLDVLYKFELEGQDHWNVGDEQKSSMQIDAGKVLEPPVEWQPPSASSEDLLTLLKRNIGSLDDNTNDIPPAKVMYDALQVAAADKSLGTAIARLEKTQPNSESSREMARLKKALEWVYEEAESTRALVVRRRANKRVLSAQ